MNTFQGSVWELPNAPTTLQTIQQHYGLKKATLVVYQRYTQEPMQNLLRLTLLSSEPIFTT